jgi:hypothetical protein
MELNLLYHSWDCSIKEAMSWSAFLQELLAMFFSMCSDFVTHQLNVYCRGVVTLVDTKVLVVFLDSSEDIVCLQDVLSMVIDLLEHKPFLSTFAEHVSEMGGCQIFIDLLKRYQPMTCLILNPKSL